AKLEASHKAAESSLLADHVFPLSNAWIGAAPQGDKLVLQGVGLRDDTDLRVRVLSLTQALRYNDSSNEARDLPAGTVVELSMQLELLSERSKVFGGVFADLLVPYLTKRDSTKYKPDDQGDSNIARAALPPPLLREGEKVQPKWLYQFLHNPNMVRPQTVLRMPK